MQLGDHGVKERILEIRFNKTCKLVHIINYGNQ